MAAVALLALLLFAFINNIHSEEDIIILEKGYYFTFTLDNKANSSCLISRSVGEEKLVLWNTSDSSSENSTLPDGLKQRLTVSIGEWDKKTHYRIHNLTHSDSGLYQEECWTDGNVTSERNISIIICSRRDEEKRFPVGGGHTVDLPCEDAADGLEIQWLMTDRYSRDVENRYTGRETLWTRVFKDSLTSVTDIVKGGFQVVKQASGPRQSNITTAVDGYFTCLVMNQQQCVSSQPVQVYIPGERIYRSVGETVVFQCDGSGDDKPCWKKLTQGRKVFQNESLVFSSLALSDSGMYSCQSYYSSNWFDLLVCPKFGPPDVELFSGGENVTIRCIGDLSEVERFYWFMKSKQTNGSVVYQDEFDQNRIITSDGSVTIFNVSLEDTGEYWCAVRDSKYQCVSTAQTLLMYSSRPVQVEIPREIIYRSVGETAVFQCEGSGDDEPRWEKKTSQGQEVFQNESLVFSSLALSDSGVYRCESYHSSNYFELFVCPKFGPPDVELFSGGENVTIRCIGDLSGRQGLHWFMKSKQTNGSVVHQNKFDRNRIVTSDKSVTIFNVSLEDTGEYWCAAVIDSYHLQCVSSAQTLLMYSSRPVQVEIPREIIYRSVGETAVFQCEGSDDDKPRWKKKTSQGQEVFQNESLVFSSLALSDSGVYRCQSYHSWKDLYLVVCPKFGPPDVDLFSGGENVTIRCIGDLSEGEKFLWFMKSKQTNGSVVYQDEFDRNRIVTSGGSVTIFNVSLEDTGEYWCAAVIDSYHLQCVSSAQTLLMYSSRPVQVEIPREIIYRLVGETAVLQCDGSGDDEPRWEKRTSQGREVFQNESLVFSSLALSDSGWYRCESYHSSYDLYLYVCPKFGPPDVELFSGGENVTIKCIGDLSGRRGFHWFMMSKQTNGSVVHQNKFDRNRIVISGGSVTILNVSLEDTGEYWCAVIDRYPYHQCVSTAKTLLMYRDPFGFYSTFYKVRCVVVSILLVVLCVTAAIASYIRPSE